MVLLQKNVFLFFFLALVVETLMHKKYEIVELCKELQKQPFICGDYKELVSLVLLYLSDNETEFVGFNRPGKLHRG